MKIKTKFLVFLLALAIFTASGAVFETAQAIFHQGNELCNEVNDLVEGLLDCGEEDIVRFSGFQGGLTPPTGEGLDSTLTGAKTLREFILNTVNFALTFLGIIAVVIVIYGGFMYVTAAGNEEQSTKGKKAIQYAAIGILIILVSFALVNTLLSVSGGGGEGADGTGRGGTGAGLADSELRGSGLSGTNIGQQTIYTLAAGSINASLNDLMGAYKNFVATRALIKRIKALPGPTTRPDNRNYANEIGSLLGSVKSNSNIFSKTHITARQLLDEWEALTSDRTLFEEEFDPNAGEDDTNLKEQLTSMLSAFDLTKASKADLENAINEIIGKAPKNEEGKLGIAKRVLHDIASVLDRGPNELNRSFATDKDLQKAFAGIDPNITVREVFDSAITNVAALRNPPAEEDPGVLLAAVKSLNQLYLMVKNIEFVFVKIKASVREGNAPLTVELNGLDSRDPTGETIQDERYEWDPKGVIQRASGSRPGEVTVEDYVDSGSGGRGGRTSAPAADVECNPESKAKATIVCTYNQPGTYIVRLRIPSSEPNNIALGQAFLPITVLPSVARIGLTAKAGDREEVLHKFEEDENGKWNTTADKNEFQVLTSQAQSEGVTFDAGTSSGGDGSEVAGYSWNFGDGKRVETGKTKTHKYEKEGSFPLRLEITNGSGRKARKLVNIIVASIIAAIQSPQTSEPEELVEFDGSLSQSDRGAISSYKWDIIKEATAEGSDSVLNNDKVLTVLGAVDQSSLRVKIKKSGNYIVSLMVTDATGSANTNTKFSVLSRKPRANFSMNFPQKQKPNLVTFDASGSFDPDRDTLLYKWVIVDEQGNEMTKDTGFSIVAGSAEPSSGAEFSVSAKLLRLQFKKIGKFIVRLEVQDDVGELSQIDVREKEIEITSIVEAEFATNQQTSAQMADGKATFVFSGPVHEANRVEIDFGDKETLEQAIELDPAARSGRFEFTRDYTNAGAYLVTVRAISDEGNGEMQALKRVYVGAGDAPLPIIQVYVDGNEIVLPDPTTENPDPMLEVIRKKAIKFEAIHSLTSSGREGGLDFSWDFGDSKRSTGGSVDKSYKDVAPADAPYTVTLTVTEQADRSKTAQTTYKVNVVSRSPQVNTLALEKKSAGLVTPLDIKLTAEGAVDEDGRITNFQFWYFDPNDRERKLGVTDTQNDNAVITVETEGEADQEREYLFCVSVTDNENSETKCSDMFQDEELPKLKVKNGPNKAPKAEFSVNKNNVRIGEKVTFTSSSKDEDGTIKEYIWDLEGDGFQNNEPTTQTSVNHQYDKKSPASGYLVKLKVIDDKGAAGYSKEVPVFAEVKSDQPTANFSFQVQTSSPRRVKFFDASKADKKNGAQLEKWTWDFDTSAEYGCGEDVPAPKPAYCNGDKTDDIDSTDQNPIFDFPPGSQNFQVKLTVEDNFGNASEPKTAMVNLVAGSSGGSDESAVPPSASFLNAKLEAVTATGRTPGPEPILGCSPSTSEQCKKKVIHLPAGTDTETVTLKYGGSTGDIVSYKMDKDIYCDFDGAGGPRGRDDDVQNPDTAGGTCTTANTRLPQDNCYTAKYHRFHKTANPEGKGRFKTMLTVEDREGNVDTDFVEIVFDGETPSEDVIVDRCELPQSVLGGSLFKRLGPRNTILGGLVAGATVALIGFWVAGMMRRGRRRI